jgi:hypothetical protein
MSGGGAALGGMASGIGGAVAAKKQASSLEAMSKKQMKQERAMYEQSGAERERYSQMVAAETEIAREQLRSAETARGTIMSKMGAAGTYGPSAGAPSTKGPIGLSLLGPTGLQSVRKGGAMNLTGNRVTKSGQVRGGQFAVGEKAAWEGKKNWDVSGIVDDADTTAAAAMGTSGFRQASQMVAESEQLLNREGPLWNEMQNSVVGGIYENAASAGREAAQILAREAARGGDARSRAIQGAQRMRAQENVNQERTTALWQSKLAMEQWVRDNAKTATNYATAWADNQSGVRNVYTSALTNLRTMWSRTMPAALMTAENNSAQISSEGTRIANETMRSANYSKNVAQTQAITGIFSSAVGGS